MKIFVDELPITCYHCIFEDDGKCRLLNKEVWSRTSRREDCVLVELPVKMVFLNEV